jgi:4-amino-4-deoxy-L-arabinose transferase-like glycosyltransferase
VSTDQDPPSSRFALYVALAIAVVLRVLWPFAHLAPMVDEGGWPFSVRQWATEGLITYDFHVAPAYHVILGGIFKLTSPSLAVARWSSVGLSLGSLGLFWWVSIRLLADRRVALWATLLWTSCFPATDIAQRALIEPLQLLWLLGLLAALCLSGAGAGLAVGIATLGLLLTKANALVLLPVFAAALWLSGPAVLRERRVAKIGGMLIGVSAAVVAFFMLYRHDPATFADGWGGAMAQSTDKSPMPLVRLGRFVLDPRLIESGVKWLSAQAPFLFALGIVGTLRALLLQRLSVAAMWVTVLLPFLLVQVSPLPNYFFLLYPPLALASADLLAASAHEGGRRWRWPTVAVLFIALDGIVRTATLMATVRAPDRQVVAWLSGHAAPEDRVFAAPYVLMQLRGRGISLFSVTAAAAAPDSVTSSPAPPQWIVVDPGEWRNQMRNGGYAVTEIDSWFARCCSLTFADAGYRVYRVRPRAGEP